MYRVGQFIVWFLAISAVANIGCAIWLAFSGNWSLMLNLGIGAMNAAQAVFIHLQLRDVAVAE